MTELRCAQYLYFAFDPILVRLTPFWYKRDIGNTLSKDIGYTYECVLLS